MKKESFFTDERTIESVGYDVALAMALRDGDIKEPYDVIRRTAQYLPQCIQAAKDFKDSQKKKPFKIPDHSV